MKTTQSYKHLLELTYYDGLSFDFLIKRLFAKEINKVVSVLCTTTMTLKLIIYVNERVKRIIKCFEYLELSILNVDLLLFLYCEKIKSVTYFA